MHHSSSIGKQCITQKMSQDVNPLGVGSGVSPVQESSRLTPLPTRKGLTSCTDFKYPKHDYITVAGDKTICDRSQITLETLRCKATLALPVNYYG